MIMPPYFKPLRWKLGVVTLMIACVLMIGWIRSRATFDCLMFPDKDSSFRVFFSLHSSVGWTRLAGNESSHELHPFWSSTDVSNQSQLLNRPEIAWKWRRLGFGFAEDRENLKRLGVVPYWSAYDPITVISGWVIPYWSIVLPLTAVSGWLLLSKPRAKIEPSIPPASENA